MPKEKTCNWTDLEIEKMFQELIGLRRQLQLTQNDYNLLKEKLNKIALILEV